MKSYDELKALIEQRGVHAEFGDAGEGWGIEQNPHELATFLVRMQELGVQSVLEIGTGYKGGLSRFLAHDMGWTVTSVDINAYHHIFPGVSYIVGKNPVITGKFDLVFIDGDHSYESVVSDYEVYFDNAEKVVAFHDICGLRDCEGSEDFWFQFKKANTWNKTFEAIADEKTRSGIGWIQGQNLYGSAVESMINKVVNTPWTVGRKK